MSTQISLCCIRAAGARPFLYRFPLFRLWSVPSRVIHLRSYLPTFCTKTTVLSRMWFMAPPVAVLIGAYFKNGLKIVAHCETARPSGARVALQRSRRGQRLKPLLVDLWLAVKPESALLLLAVVAAVCAAIVNIQIPLLLGNLINLVSGLDSTSDIGALYPHGVTLLAYYAAQSGLTFFYIFILSIAGENIGTRLRNRLFSSLIMQDIAFFDVNRTGELMARLSGDVQEFKSSFKSCISQGLRAVTQIAGCAISLYLISPKMTLATVTIVPCVVGLGSVIGAGLRTMSFMAQEQVAAALMIAEEALANVKTVRAFAAEEIETKKFAEELDKAKILNTSLGFGIGLFQGAVNMTLNVIVLGVIYGGSTLIIREEVSKGDIMSFLVTVQTIQRSLAQLSLLFGQAVRGISAAGRVFEYVHMWPAIRTSGGKRIPFHSLLGEIEFRGVSFVYSSRPEQQVLDDFNLSIPRGKMVALVGASGAGKSTVASLMERFYDPQVGQILLDGYDLKTLDPKWLRGEAIGYIAQEPVLFDGTIEENIRYGKPGASFLEVEEVAKQANAHQFIKYFANGYSTKVGERGTNLSGGQKQRIAIARALLKNPRIMILDEATSALDAESEKLVKDALNKAIEGRTVLIIAHRLSTIRNADLIAVVDRGKIVELGTHDELRKLKGIYNNLVQHQSGDDLIETKWTLW